jgi:hypothetical protein
MAVSRKGKIEPEIEPELVDADADDMQEELERSAADMEKMREALEHEREESARLRGELDGGNEDGGLHDGEHVIDLPGRLRRAWRYPNFRLFILMLAVFAGAVFDRRLSGREEQGLGLLWVALFIAWSLRQFRKRGLAQLVLKWLVFFVALEGCAALRVELGLERDLRAIGAALAVVMVLTFSKISEWLGHQIRVHVWESGPVETVKGWF